MYLYSPVCRFYATCRFLKMALSPFGIIMGIKWIMDIIVNDREGAMDAHSQCALTTLLASHIMALYASHELVQMII